MKNKNNILIRELISFRQFALLCRKKKLDILVCIIIFGLIGYLMSQTITKPKYNAETQIMIQTKNKFSAQSQTGNNPVITYKDLITSSKVMNEVSSKLNNRVTASQLAHATSVENTQDSQLVSISVKLDSAEESYIAANTLTNYLKNYSKGLVSGTNVKVLSYAKVPGRSSIYSPIFQSISGGIIGLILSLVIILMQAYISPRVYEPEFIEDQLGVQVLGEVSFDKKLGEK